MTAAPGSTSGQQIALFPDDRPLRPDGALVGAAWQKQLRDHYLSEGTPAVPHLDLKRAVVRPISRSMAARVIFKYEWLGTMSATRWHFGIFFGEWCAGVTCVVAGAGTASPKTAGVFGLEQARMAVLARGACVHWAPPGTNSKLVSWTCRLLAMHADPKLVLAFSDPEAGEIGTIYQACNWVYVGKTAQTYRVIAPNGAVYDRRRLDSWAKRDGVERSTLLRGLLETGWRVEKTAPKGRYVCILDRSDRALTERVESMRQPYPKRAGVASILADAPAVQAGEGRAALTATLRGVS